MSTNKSIFEHTRKVTQQRFQNLKLLSGITMYFIGSEPRAIRRSINTERLDRVISSEKIGIGQIKSVSNWTRTETKMGIWELHNS